jgi:hypothetical protein
VPCAHRERRGRWTGDSNRSGGRRQRWEGPGSPDRGGGRGGGVIIMRCARRRARVPCAHQERRGGGPACCRAGGRAGGRECPRPHAGASRARVRACGWFRAGRRASGRASELAEGGRAEGLSGGGSAAARGRTLPVPGVARACRARTGGAAGQVDRRFQPLRQKEAAQEGPASPGRGEGVENHEAGGCARAVALLRGREGGRAGAGSGRASGRACGRAGGRAGRRACGWAGRRAGGQPNVLSCAGARGRLGQRAPPESLGPALPPGRHQRSCRLARQRSIPGA